MGNIPGLAEGNSLDSEVVKYSASSWLCKWAAELACLECAHNKNARIKVTTSFLHPVSFTTGRIA